MTGLLLFEGSTSIPQLMIFRPTIHPFERACEEREPPQVPEGHGEILLTSLTFQAPLLISLALNKEGSLRKTSRMH